MDIVVCSKCGQAMERIETITGQGLVDWSLEEPVCPICRGVPGARPLERNHNVVGGINKQPDPQSASERIIARRVAIAEALTKRYEGK